VKKITLESLNKLINKEKEDLKSELIKEYGEKEARIMFESLNLLDEVFEQ